eukprot:CAMPEP_0178519454 /NCGR_PEP_ID=MMETSP0696-20121128/26836_1 /TAXON_ID=265572 /ORGANISM="Extubocellulus spinifer, Strain CCMP396" /LENGTH=272 /DNA_ID=CAMNT_0020150159 /DNA_START=89 /DNA_END=907 /DNA_ORIENTATION=-
MNRRVLAASTVFLSVACSCAITSEATSTRTCSILQASAAAFAPSTTCQTNECIGARAVPAKRSSRLRLTSFSTSNNDKAAPVDQASTSASPTTENNALSRRSLLTYMLLAATSASTVATTTAAVPCNAFAFGTFSSASEGPKPMVAVDIAGRPIVASEFVSTRGSGDRSMVQGLKSDPTYLIVTAEGSGLEPYAINAECTHLGCVVPWDSFQKKFICPCHGSQYDSRGAVIRGPAPGPLKLAKVGVEEDTGKVLLENWADEDFRTGENPWWM